MNSKREFVGGHVVVDLVNTVTEREHRAHDRLEDYTDLLRWARASGAFESPTLTWLESCARRSPATAKTALRDVKRLRYLVRATLSILIDGGDPKPQLAALGALWRTAASRAGFVMIDGKAVIVVLPERALLHYITHTLTLYAVDLLTSLNLDRIRICDGDHCGWMFIDTSRGGQRRWCDMAVCGNYAKAGKFQRKHRASSHSRRA